MPLEAADCNLEVVEGHCDDQSPDREGRNDARTRDAGQRNGEAKVGTDRYMGAPPKALFEVRAG